MRLIYRLRQIMLATGDLLSFVIGFWISLTIRYLETPPWEIINSHLSPFFWLFLFWIVINFINGLYDLAHLKHKDNFRHFLEAALLSLLFGFLFFYIWPSKNIAPKTILMLNIFLGYGLSYLWRLIYNRHINTKALQTNIIFLGFTNETEELIRILNNFPERGYKISAVIDPDNLIKPVDFPFFEVYHSLTAIRPAVSNFKTQMLVIAPHLKKNDEILRELYNLLFWGVQIVDLTSFYEVITGRIPPCTFSEAWFLENLKKEQIIYEKIRTAVDYLVGILMGLLFIILLPFLAIFIKLNSPGPLFFKQNRIGQYGKTFAIYKFRSMLALSADGSAETQGAQFASKNDERITKIGKILRKTRLDELPQFINLLKRNLTLIGPRPERPEIVAQLEQHITYYPLRHIVKPGITGWAVVHQNYTDSIEASLQKLQYDLYYIKNRSPFLDLSIILRTINVIMRLMGQ